MAWVKKDFIFKPDGSQPWAQTHSQVPTALVLDDVVRIYYAARDVKGRSITSYIDVAKDDLTRILYQHDRPVLELGKPGTHDQDGAMSGCVVKQGNDVYFYYTGWSREVSVPYRVTVGMAKSTDGGVSFTRLFDGPVVDRTAREPYMTMSPYVLVTDGLWQMWYGSGTGWVDVDGKMEPLYQVKYAESDDGIHWRQDDVLCIEQSHPLEANTRPSIMRTADGYEMWFSYRHSIGFRSESGGYRIGYATSKDGKVWARHADQDGLEPTVDGWTKNMIAYPNVIELNGQKIMFFNGDGFGRAGFGYAVWEN